MVIHADRLATIKKLYKGAHRPDGLMCMMEAVAYVAGETWSAEPVCACPVLAAYGRGINDSMPDGQRERLLAFIPKLIGTRATPAVEQRRAYLFADAAVRVFAPIALRAAEQKDAAALFEAVPMIIDKVTAAAAYAAAYAYAADARAARAAAYTAAARAALTNTELWDAALDVFDRAIAIS